MTRHHMQDGVVVPFTPEEEAARDVEEAMELSERPMRMWQRSMEATDSLPRYVEDLYDTGITPSDRTKKLLDDKKALRAERPGS